MKEHKLALLLINTQVNMFANENSVNESESLLDKLKTLVQQARKSEISIVFLQNCGNENDPDEPGSVGWYIHPDLTPAEGEKVIQKSEMDAFEKTNLASYLQQNKILKIMIVGMQSEFCVATNCRMAKKLGFDVILVKDAHSTYDSSTETAQELIDEVNLEMQKLVSVQSTEVALKELQK